MDEEFELLIPIAAELADRAQAACASAPSSDMFFPDPDLPDEHQEIINAVAYCVVCPVRKLCLQEALNGEYDGIWGGTTARQRVDIKKRRARELRAASRPADYVSNNTANKNRAEQAAAREVELLTNALLTLAADEISDRARSYAELRIKNPTMSYSELAAAASPSTTKDAFISQIRRVLKKASL